MSNDNSVVKSFRTSEEQFNQANEIFKKEGFSFSEVVRLLFEATIKEGHIPRILNSKERESEFDNARMREDYITSILNMGISNRNKENVNKSAEDKLLDALFGKEKTASEMSNAELREWAAKWGLPDNLAVSTLEDLYKCGLFISDPWVGDFEYDICPETYSGSEIIDKNLMNALVIMKFKDNLNNNLEKVKHKMLVSATKELIELDNIKNRKES